MGGAASGEPSRDAPFALDPLRHESSDRSSCGHPPAHLIVSQGGGSSRSGAREGGAPRTRVTAGILARATLTQSRKVFVVNALRRLLDDDHFLKGC